MSKGQQSARAFYLTVIVAGLLAVVPLPETLQMFWPSWMALLVIFWALESPRYLTLGFAFAVGLALDILTVSLFGLHALRLVILAYLVLRFRARLRFFPPWQLGAAVFALLVNDRIILLWINTMVGEPLPPLSFWLPAISGALAWPAIFLLFDRIRSQARRRSV